MSLPEEIESFDRESAMRDSAVQVAPAAVNLLPLRTRAMATGTVAGRLRLLLAAR